MATRVHYPIPEPERSELIAAGKLAERMLREYPQSASYEEAHAEVQKVIDRITDRYGFEVEDEEQA